MQPHFTIIGEGRVVETQAIVDGSALRIPLDAVLPALGWEVKPQGLCKDDVCIPVQSQPALLNSDGVDLVALTALTAQPLAVDHDERVACVGESARARGAQLATLQAPDFSLPDLDGRRHALSDFRGKRVLLAAWASW